VVEAVTLGHVMWEPRASFSFQNAMCSGRALCCACLPVVNVPQLSCTGRLAGLTVPQTAREDAIMAVHYPIISQQP
jgi:hypothetical protein